MALPYLDNPGTLDEMTVMELDGLVAKLNAFLRVEHNQQGGHTTITAESVVVDGPVTVRDEQLAPASFQRSVKLGTQIAITPTPGGTTPWLTVIYDRVEDVRLGQVSGGIYTGPGTRLGPAFAAGGTSPQPWDVVATSVSAGPALVFGDPVRHDRPLVLMFNIAGAHYEVRPNAVASEVWLGAATGATNQFARAYLSDGVYQRGRAVAMGDWQDVPFNAANFTGNGSMTWTVASSNVGTLRYALVGQTLHYTVALTGTTVGGVANTELLLALPAGYTVAATVLVPFIYQQDVGILTGFCRANPGDTTLRLSKLTLANWTLIVANVFLSITCEVTG